MIVHFGNAFCNSTTPVIVILVPSYRNTLSLLHLATSLRLLRIAASMTFADFYLVKGFFSAAIKGSHKTSPNKMIDIFMLRLCRSVQSQQCPAIKVVIIIP